MKARHLKMVAAGLLAALGLCMAQPTQAQAWDAWEIPEPGAADGWVLQSKTGTLAPLYDQYYTQYTVDSQGRVDSVVDVGDFSYSATTYTYDNQGRIASETWHETDSITSPATGKMDYVYREDGSCVEYVTYYDGSERPNRPTWTSFPESPIGNDFSYGGLRYGYYGLWNYEMQDGHVATASRTWNRIDNYGASGNETRTYTYEFDAEGRVAKMNCDVVTTYGYADTYDEVTPSTSGYSRETSQEVTTYTYNPDGSHTIVCDYGGSSEVYVFNAKGQLTQFRIDTEGSDSPEYPVVRNYEYDEYGNNVKITDPNNTESFNGTKMGIRTYTYKRIENADSDDMFRMYNTKNGEHLYTKDLRERNAMLQGDWICEGIMWSAPKTSGKPIYRLRSSKNGDHHYADTEKEYLALQNPKNGWIGEGIAFYSADEGTGTPIYRLFNPKAKGVGAHNYTDSTNERDANVKAGWNYEGIGWYGLK